MTCPCDEKTFPPKRTIPAGLPGLPRQIAGFPEFRTAMLALIPEHPALRHWRARGAEDFGLLLIDMWAYVCDVLSFYDQTLANEAYLRTARLLPSVRKLVALLGYVPRPAIAASVRLGIIADGRTPLKLPAGTAFRSGAFDGQPPQIFETDADAVVHPDANKWSVVAPRPTTLSGTLFHILLKPSTAKVKKNQPLLIQFSSADADTYVRRVLKVEPTVEADGGRYTKVSLYAPIVLSSPKLVSQVRVKTPAAKGAPWQTEILDPNTYVLENAQVTNPNFKSAIIMDGLYRRIHRSDIIVAETPGTVRWFRVVKGRTIQMTVVPEKKITIGEPPNDVSVKVPAVQTPATRLVLHDYLWPPPTLPNPWNVPPSNPDPFDPQFTPIEPIEAEPTPNVPDWANNLISADWWDRTAYTIHYDMVDAGTVVAPANTVLTKNDALDLKKMHSAPTGAPTPTRFLLASADQRGVEITGAADFVATEIDAAPKPTFTPPLELPVTVYGNVVDATRGERVPLEVLGNGGSSVPSQSFTLKKKPLTYVASAAATNEWGAISTLKVWVNGFEWTEVPSLFSAQPHDHVYIVRQRDDGTSVVTFGDGIRGSRLPTGVGNVTASYRFGAGAASPPARTIKQIARPVHGLKSVVNPVAADGGADAELPFFMRVNAPRSALLLGRIVSIEDFEAAAAAVAGVILARAEWRWQPMRQRPVAHVWYVGGIALASTVSQRLRSLADPSTPIHVEHATLVPAHLHVDLETDARRRVEDVIADANIVLGAYPGGLLRVINLGIDRPLYRSEIFRRLFAVPGVLGVRALHYDNQSFPDYGITPGPGKFFDFIVFGSVLVTGSPRTDG